MGRLRADDYDEKLQAILNAAAALFATHGYPTAKMEDIARMCGAKKSMLYHYFPTKDDLLFALLKEHMDHVLGGVEQAIQGPGSAEERFFNFVQTYTQKSSESTHRHVVVLNDLKYLPDELQAELRQQEVQLTELIATTLRELNPGLREEVYKPYTMLLIGMLNWMDVWYKPAGKVKPQELCERTSRLFLRGFLAERPDEQNPAVTTP